MSLLLIASFLCAEEKGTRCATQTLRKLIKNNDFKRGRSLEAYERLLGTNFTAPFFDSQKNKRQLHYMDLGAGNMVAARELAGDLRITETIKSLPRYFRYEENITRPNVSAVSFTVDSKDKKFPTSTQYGQYWTGRFFEDIPTSQLLKRFGKVDLATDTFGVMGYTDRPTLAINKVHQLLNEDGAVLIYLGAKDYEQENGKITSSLWGTQVKVNSKKTIPYPIWLKDEVKGFDSEIIELKNGKTLLRMRRIPHSHFSAKTLTPIKILNADTLPPHRLFGIAE